MIKDVREIFAELQAWADRLENATPAERKQMAAELRREEAEHNRELKESRARLKATRQGIKRMKELHRKIERGEASFEEKTEYREKWIELENNIKEDSEKGPTWTDTKH